MKLNFKKVTLTLLLFLVSLTLFACGGETPQDVFDSLELVVDVSEDFDLPKHAGDATLVWTSGNTEIISISNKDDNYYLAEINPRLENQVVTLSVEITLKSATETFPVDVTVLAVDEIVHTVSVESVFGTDVKEVVDQSVIDFGELDVENYAFIGIFTDDTYTQTYDMSSVVTSDLSLFAYYVEIPGDNQAIVDLDAQLIENYYSLDADGYHVDLMSKGYAGSNILWSSSDLNVLTNAGFILAGPTETTVTMTATIRGKRGTESREVEFEVTIPAYDNSLEEEFDTMDIPFTNITSEYEVADTTLETYYFGDSTIPYVDVESYLEMLDGFIDFPELEFVYEGSVLTISYVYVYEDEGENGELVEMSETYSAVLDLEANTLSVETLDFFDGYIKSTATDYSEGINYLDDTYYEEGSTVVFDFDAYRIATKVYENEGETEFLLPFHIVNLIFTGGAYYNVYYNGDSYYGVYAAPDGDDLETIKTSSLNETDMGDEMLRFNYDTMALVLNVYYGLKNDRNVDDYYNVLQEYQSYLLSTNPESISSGFFNLVTKTLDDLHTSTSFMNVYNEPSFDIPLTSVSQLGPLVGEWYNVLFDVQDEIDDAFPLGTPPDYRFLDEEKTTAVIYLDGFVTASVDETKSKDNDSDAYMQYVLNAIFRENPDVENIAVDLSYNTGGNLGALLRVLGYMTEDPIQMSYQNPTEGSNLTYFIDLDQEAYTDVNWYIITSRVTFSAANLMTAIAKNQGFATILGTTSGGGASSIIPVIFPNGSMFTMSSLNVLSVRIDNGDGTFTYQSIEHGVEPDYELPVYRLYDDAFVLDLIQSINQE